ncbi:hypothetical protein [Streptomyces sp. ST2-7A]|uniref:hypothetical protein n=1 Tax=Streptomyces sp. ST2-7A TaxID=2907214 RepID=UPI001F31ABE7|nr:hypothetical protein [Streptomyces sp. ST2-7A]MCE7081734.1 hypothetical protein [Streptomyces sp. ST2-7A]
MDKQFENEIEAVAYTPGLISELGTVTGATLGWATDNNADDTEYFNGTPHQG